MEKNDFAYKKKKGGLNQKNGSTISIPGTKLGTCQVSAQKVDPWSRYARDRRTDARTHGHRWILRSLLRYRTGPMKNTLLV